MAIDDSEHNADDEFPLSGIGIVGTALLFGGAGLLLFGATRVGIPRLVTAAGVEPIVAWFVAGGLGVFLPLVVVAVLILAAEGSLWRSDLWSERLRFRSMDRGDWAWSVGGLVLIGLLGGASLFALQALWPEAKPHPSFMTLEPLGPGRYWILAAWLPLWVVNILGEELLWRGVVLPRQEIAFGRRAWLANALGWLAFHVAFGPTLLVLLWPIVFILPYVAQRRRNSWTGVVIHAGLNGPGFVAVALGAA